MTILSRHSRSNGAYSLLIGQRPDDTCPRVRALTADPGLRPWRALMQGSLAAAAAIGKGNFEAEALDS